MVDVRLIVQYTAVLKEGHTKFLMRAFYFYIIYEQIMRYSYVLTYYYWTLYSLLYYNECIRAPRHVNVIIIHNMNLVINKYI